MGAKYEKFPLSQTFKQGCNLKKSLIWKDRRPAAQRNLVFFSLCRDLGRHSPHNYPNTQVEIKEMEDEKKHSRRFLTVLPTEKTTVGLGTTSQHQFAIQSYLTLLKPQFLSCEAFFYFSSMPL